jgi:hypothetical protein
MKFLEPVRDYKARHASTLLTFDAVIRLPRPDRGPRQGRRRLTCQRSAKGRNWRRPLAQNPGAACWEPVWCGLYQLTLSGFIGNSCRHLPTCSEYAYEAIARHGLWKGMDGLLFPGWPLRPWRHPRHRQCARKSRMPRSWSGGRRGGLPLLVAGVPTKNHDLHLCRTKASSLTCVWPSALPTLDAPRQIA